MEFFLPPSFSFPPPLFRVMQNIELFAKKILHCFCLGDITCYDQICYTVQYNASYSTCCTGYSTTVQTRTSGARLQLPPFVLITRVLTQNKCGHIRRHWLRLYCSLISLFLLTSVDWAGRKYKYSINKALGHTRWLAGSELPQGAG